MQVLQSSAEENKKRLLRNFYNRFNEINVAHKIQCLKVFLQDFIKQKTLLQPRTESRHILIKAPPPKDRSSFDKGGIFQRCRAAQSQGNASVYFRGKGECQPRSYLSVAGQYYN